MVEKYAERRKAALAFEKKHDAFLTKLKSMPKSTEEERELRWKAYRDYPLQSEFALDVLKAYNLKAYNRILKRLQGVQLDYSSDSGMASSKKNEKGERELDEVVFYTAVNRIISTFTGVTQNGESYLFLQGIGTVYGQLAQQASTRNEMMEHGISDSKLREEKLNDVLRLLKKTEEIKARMQQDEMRDISTAEAFDYLKSVIPRNAYTRKVWKLAEGFTRPAVSYLDKAVGEDEDGETTILMDYQGEDEKRYQEALDKDFAPPFIESFIRNVEKRWKNIQSAKDLREQQNIRMFFTRDILRVLKLDEEGEPYSEEPAGNEEFYNSLRPQGDFMYERVFNKNYLNCAFVVHPENFYMVYVRLLKKGFDFTNKTLAELEGKHPGTISKQHDRYKELMKCFYDYYMEEE